MAVIPSFIDRSLFFAQVRPLFGHFTQSQVEGIERLLDVWAQFYVADPIEFLAYNLATAFHETAETMQPIMERGPRSYFDKYEPGTKLGKILGNTQKGDDTFRGEGDVQNTDRANAARATRELNAIFKLNIDLVANPSLRGDLMISAHSLFLGNKQGWWTGRKLGDYIKPGKSLDFEGARAVVNGQDDAALIARYAVTFLRALTFAAARPVQEPPAPAPVAPAAPAPAAQTAVSANPLLALIAAIVALFTRKIT